MEKRVYNVNLEKAEIEKEKQNFTLAVERLEREVVMTKKKVAADALVIQAHIKEKEVFGKNLKKNAGLDADFVMDKYILMF